MQWALARGTMIFLGRRQACRVVVASGGAAGRRRA